MVFPKIVNQVVVIVGIVLIGISLILHYGNFLNKEIIQRMHLGRDENGEFNNFLKKTIDPPYKMEMKVWIYSVINDDEVVNNGTRPILIEKGPFVFSETHHKTDVKFTANDSRLLYRNNRLFFFNRSLSCKTCDLKEKVIIPNIVFQKFVDKAEENFLFKFFLDNFLNFKHETAYLEVTAGDLLFNGFKDPLISDICNLFGTEKCKSFGLKDKIAIFDQLNNTDDGLYEIDSGIPDINTLGSMYAYKGMKRILNDSFWSGSEARMMNGTNSELFPPFHLLSAKNFQIFVGTICRSIEMQYAEQVNVQGLSVYRYKQSKLIQNIPLQKHMGFCLPNTPKFFNDSLIQSADCLPATLLDLTQCVTDHPRIYYSNSHFLYAPAQLLDSMDGLIKPNPTVDETTLDIDPLTGVIVQAAQRYQLNVGVLRGNLSIVKNMIPALIVPMIRAENYAIFDSETRAQLLKIYSLKFWSSLFKISLFIIGLGLEIFYVSTFVLEKHNLISFKSANNLPLLNSNENENFIQTQPNMLSYNNQ